MQRVTWSRSEPFGAWVRFEDGTLAAIDRRLARAMGVPSGDASARVRPLEVHVAVTTRCSAGCAGCYVDARPEGHEPSFEDLCARLAEARDAGASTVALGGGEPLARRDLGRVAGVARDLGLLPVMTTSGIGLTEQRAAELTSFAQVNVSHDGVGAAYALVRGFDGRAVADRAIRLLVAAGVPVGVNVVLARGSLDHVEATADHVADLGAREVQLLRYKPSGRAAEAGYHEKRLSLEQVRSLFPLIERLCDRRRLRVRIDCAMVPLLSEALLARVESAGATLAALGVFGCEAARHLGALGADGGVAPCSFTKAPGSADPLPLGEAWERDRELERFREYHADPPEPCRSCALFSVCRGGCQVVSRFAAGGAMRPDPECPRVMAWESAGEAG